MARKEMDLGTFDGLNVHFAVEDDSVPAGTGTVPGMVVLTNNNPYPITELEGQFNSMINIMPSSFSYARINPGSSKTVHILLNVLASTKPADYEIKVDLDFKIDTPPATSNALVVSVTEPVK